MKPLKLGDELTEEQRREEMPIVCNDDDPYCPELYINKNQYMYGYSIIDTVESIDDDSYLDPLDLFNIDMEGT